MQASQYFSLIVPLCGILLGAALIACWAVLRRHRYLLWLAAGYILPALPLAAQSVMSNQQMAATSTLLGLFYLVGFWALAQGMAKKYGGSAHPRIAAAIGGITLCVLYYFSQVTDQLQVRMLVLNVAMALLLVLGVLSVYRQSHSAADRWERVLRASFLVFVGYALVRAAVIAVYIWNAPLPALSQSPLWLLMLATNLVLSLWFVSVLLVVTVREMLVTLQRERDRDPLTQLFNRRAFFELASVRMGRPETASWALAVCDVDHFKHVNDDFGHAAGDAVLQHVARVLLRNVRPEDLVVRFGGEEFVIMLRCANLAAATAVVQRMREQLAQQPCPSTGCRVTASFGVAMVESMAGLHAAIQQADALMYQAKRAGRNQVVHPLNATQTAVAPL